MAWHKWKPETIARHNAVAKVRAKERHEQMIVELKEKADAEGPGSIWAEMLAETLERDAAEPDRFA